MSLPRALTASALVFALAAAGCGTAPIAPDAIGFAADGDLEALASPTNREALALAKGWQRDAVQVGVMINRSPKGVRDSATFVYQSRKAKTRMLLVIASRAGLEAQEVGVNDRGAEGLANALPITDKQGRLLSSKKIFKQAEHLGLDGAEDMVVMQTRTEGKALPIAIVTDRGGANYIVLDALTGEPLTPVSKLGARKVQVHILIIGGVVLAVAVGAAVWWAVKKWRNHGKPVPTPAPTDRPTPGPGPTERPTPIPTATPVPTPVPTSKPASALAPILAGPFGAQFDRLDKDRDGVLSAGEFLAPAKDDATKRVKTKQYAEYLDARHDGRVNKDAFLKGTERYVVFMGGISFSMLDSDQNGGLDRTECAANVPANDFSAADTNRDGKLSQAEYMVPYAMGEADLAQYYGK